MARKDKSESKQTPQQFWTAEIESAEKEFERWLEKGQQIVRRYRDDRDVVSSRVRRFNILWSNVQVMKPALYGRMPKPMVNRRFKDSDPIGRAASTMLERCLEYEVEEYPDFQRTMRCAVEDRLLPGRGVAWVRYEPHFRGDDANAEIVQVTTPKAPDVADAGTGAVTEDVSQQLDYECAPTDYVHWKDFLHEPARTWEEVSWVARRVFMTHAEGEKRFGEIFALVPLSSGDKKKDSESPRDFDKKKKAEVWEIWDKTKKEVHWIAKNFTKQLDERADPLRLEQFFPCPMPLFATVTTGSLVPVPDYAEYQDQAEELDKLTQRISRLTAACKVVGVYDASVPALARMLTEGVDNTMIPVTEWESFSEKNGLKGSIQFMQIKEIIETLLQLYGARDQAKQVIYETIGLSDILRGSSVASETLGAQQLKAQFGSMRLRTSQEDVARFASDLLRMKAHIICTLFSDETILRMSGIEYTQDADQAQAALALLRQGTLKDFRIEVSADTLAQLDENKDKEDRLEFLKATGGFLEKALPVIMAQPSAGPLLGEMLMFGVRGFHVGRSVEAAFERSMAQMGQALQQPKPPDPKLEVERMKAETENARSQAEMEKIPLAKELVQMKHQAAMAKANNTLQTAQAEAQAIQIQPPPIPEQEKLAITHKAEMERTALQGAVQIVVARISAESKEKSDNAKAASDQAQRKADSHMAMMQQGQAESESETEPEADDSAEQAGIDANAIMQRLLDTQNQLLEAVTRPNELHGQTLEVMRQVAESMSRPRTVMRGSDGRVVGVQ